VHIGEKPSRAKPNAPLEAFHLILKVGDILVLKVVDVAVELVDLLEHLKEPARGLPIRSLPLKGLRGIEGVQALR